MAGNLSVESCGNVFASAARKASSNYGVGSDGRIGLYVAEKDRSWCSSNAANDHRAVTIEVANDGGTDTGWHVSDQAMAALINLVTDICQRNHIQKLVWSTNKNNRMKHLNGCNMTVHRDFAAKACPGDYLYHKHPYIAEQVNKKLGSKYIFENIDYSLVFDPIYYSNQYPDLKAAFGNHLPLYYKHYITNGYRENRKCV